MSKLVKNTVAVLAFSINKKARLPAIRITGQPILLSKSKINRSSDKFSIENLSLERLIFAKNGQSNLVLVLFLVLEAKDP